MKNDIDSLFRELIDIFDIKTKKILDKNLFSDIDYEHEDYMFKTLSDLFSITEYKIHNLY